MTPAVAKNMVLDKYKYPRRIISFSNINTAKDVWWLEIPRQKWADKNLEFLVLALCDKDTQLHVLKVPTCYLRDHLSELDRRQDNHAISLELSCKRTDLFHCTRPSRCQVSFKQFHVETLDGNSKSPPIEPVSGTVIPRYAGPSTFCRLPELKDVPYCDVAILGIPFDSGTSYRPGARFGPQGIRQASRQLRTNFHPAYDTEPYKTLQVADAGDVGCNPFNIAEAIEQIENAATELFEQADAIVSLGGDHTIAVPLLRAVNKQVGPVALVHFDAHLDTWDTYFGAQYTHGTPFRRAAEEGLFLDHASMHVGIRGPLYSRQDLKRDKELGFKVIHCDELQSDGIDHVIERIRRRVGDHPLYLSIDIDVLDPSHAPGTGTPEIAGMTSRELLNILRGLKGLDLVSADIVEVAPAYDHAEITSLAAATIAFEMINLIVCKDKSRLKGRE